MQLKLKSSGEGGENSVIVTWDRYVEKKEAFFFGQPLINLKDRTRIRKYLTFFSLDKYLSKISCVCFILPRSI